MSSSSAAGAETRSANQKKIDRLLVRAERIQVNYDIGKLLIKAGIDIVTEFRNEKNIEPEEVYSHLSSYLPSPKEIFCDELFQQPAFPYVWLRDLVSCFQSTDISEEDIQDIDYGNYEDLSYTSGALLWLAISVECETALKQDIFDKYMAGRGSRGLSKDNAVVKPTTSPIITVPSATEKELDTATSGSSPVGSHTSRGKVDVEPQEIVIPGNNLRITEKNKDSHSVKYVRPQQSIKEPLQPNLPPPPSNACTMDLRTDKKSSPHLAPTWITPENGFSSIAFGYPYQWTLDNDSGKVRGVNTHFQNRKFTGNIMQSIELHIRDYNICSQQHKLAPTQKADFFINTFDGAAHTFYFTNANIHMTFEELAIMNINSWANDSRKLQVQQRLENLNFQVVMASQNLSDSTEGIDHICNIIDKLSPQCELAFQHEANKINWLRRAVVMEPWASIPIGHITSHKYSYNQFVTALHEQIQLNKYKSHFSSLQSPESNHQSLIHPTHHQQYGRHPRDVRKHDPRPDRTPGKPVTAKTLNPIGKDGKRMLCYRCGAESHLANRCHIPARQVRAYYRDRVSSGEPHLLLVSDMIKALEEPNENTSTNLNDPPPMENTLPEISSEIHEFDSYFKEDPPAPHHHVAQVDQEWHESFLQDISENSHFG